MNITLLEFSFIDLAGVCERKGCTHILEHSCSLTVGVKAANSASGQKLLLTFETEGDKELCKKGKSPATIELSSCVSGDICVVSVDLTLDAITVKF